jgi:hypothetical protein
VSAQKSVHSLLNRCHPSSIKYHKYWNVLHFEIQEVETRQKFRVVVFLMSTFIIMIL